MTTPNSKWYVRKLRINSEGYTPQGYYFGTGAPVYECQNDDEYKTFRANDRAHAIEQLCDCFRGQEISFYRGEK